jgi:signal peptidase I
LGFLLPGLGHLYAGRVNLAVLLFVLFPGMNLVVGLLYVTIPTPGLNVVVPTILNLALRAGVAYDAARVLRASAADKTIPVLSRWYSCLAAVVLVTVVVNPVWVRTYRNTFVQAFALPTGSMEKTILWGDHVLAAKWSYGWREPMFQTVVFGARSPVRSDLVVFRFPEDRSRTFLKRVIGLPGETVEIRHGRVFIDGKALEETYLYASRAVVLSGDSTAEADDGDHWGPQTVAAGSYFVLGDNRDNSRDSRIFGFVGQGDILGRAVMVYWSADPEKGSIRWERIGRRLD